MENINCLVCGETNPSTLENCRNCNRPLRQTAGEMDGAERIRDSEQTLDDITPLDWLASLNDDGEEDEETAEWLVELQGDRTAHGNPEEEVASDEPITMGDVPRPSDENESSIKTDELPGWISDLRGGYTEEDAAPTAVASDEGLPDWLSDEDDASDASAITADVESQTEEAPLNAGEELPDWMLNVQSGTAAESVPMIAYGDDTADGLSSFPLEDFSAKDASVAEDVVEMEASSKESVLPAVSAVDTDEADISSAVELDLPDWLSQTEEPSADSFVETETEEAPAFFEKDAYDRLESLPSAETSSEEEGVPSISSVFIGDDDFSNIKEDGTDEIFGIEMPDWFSSLVPEETDVEVSVATDTAGADEDIADAELPSWVQAMRPIASVLSDTFDGSGEHVVAETGPLAGLSGVLGVGPGLGELSKPRAPSIKLQVSEDQQNSVAMLERLLVGESEPRPFELQDKTSSIPVLRWLIAVPLIFVVGSVLLYKTDIILSPNIIVPKLRDAILAIYSAALTAIIERFDFLVTFLTFLKTLWLP